MPDVLGAGNYLLQEFFCKPNDDHNIRRMWRVQIKTFARQSRRSRTKLPRDQGGMYPVFRKNGAQRGTGAQTTLPQGRRDLRLRSEIKT